MKLIISLLFILFIYYINQCELLEGYIQNSPPSDRPDDIQFYACHDYSSPNNLGNNNYKINYHGIGEPLQGAYSHFLNEYKLRNYDDFFHSPICEHNYVFDTTAGVSPPNEIIDHTNILNQEELLRIQDTYDSKSIKDPHYVYRHPNYIENKLLYSDEINELFIKNHRSHDSENLLHRMDINLYNK